MSVGRNTVELWKRSVPWRVTLVCAAVFTGLALFAKSSAPSGPPSTGNPAQNQTAAGGQQPPSGQGTGAAQQCGPQGQLTVQAPIVVSQSGQLPTNVQSSAPPAASQGGIPSSVLSRFRQFVTRVDAANLEQRMGERCVRMQGALDALEATDYAYADCFQEGQKKLVAAQSCSGDFGDSQARFERLLAAHDASLQDRSADKIEELARARAKMLPFDESRERWGVSDAAVSAGDAAIDEISGSDKRIAALQAVAQEDLATPQALQRLANAADLSALDRSRLTPAEEAILKKAEAARQQLQASDRRLAAVGEALQGNPAANETSRSRLISALSALTELDVSRADTSQGALIERARATAAEFALTDLIAAVDGVDIGTSAPENLERIRDLAAAARRYGKTADPAAESAGPAVAAGVAEAAYLKADQASTRLAQSDRRIAQMREMVASIETSGPSALGGEVIAIHGAITDFDRARMSDEDIRALERLDEAREITLASREGELTRSVPIYLRSKENDALSALAVTEMRRELEDMGFTLVDALERAAIEIQLTLSEVREKSVKFSGTTLNTAEVNLTTLARWTVEREPIAVPRVEGTSAGSEPVSLAREAVVEAAQAAAAEISKLAGS